MSHTRFVAHGIVSASVKSNTREGTTWTEFLFTDAAGAHHEVTVFHDDPLEIEGADFINFAARHQLADSLEALEAR